MAFREFAGDLLNKQKETKEDVQTDETHPPLFHGMHCTVCLAPTRRRCGQCGMVYYCSAECQKRDWKAGHRQTCPGKCPEAVLRVHGCIKELLERFRANKTPTSYAVLVFPPNMTTDAIQPMWKRLVQEVKKHDHTVEYFTAVNNHDEAPHNVAYLYEESKEVFDFHLIYWVIVKTDGTLASMEEFKGKDKCQCPTCVSRREQKSSGAAAHDILHMPEEK